jgi:hypothetical protein
MFTIGKYLLAKSISCLIDITLGCVFFVSSYGEYDNIRLRPVDEAALNMALNASGALLFIQKGD